MAFWRWDFDPDGEEEFKDIDRSVRQRIINKLDWLVKNFTSIKPSSLTGEYSDFFKLRVGKWRIFYKVYWKDSLIRVYYIDNRDKAYK